MANFLGKKYKLESSENFEEYMKALGVGLMTRKLGNSITSTTEITEKDGVYTLRLASTFRSQVITFKLGEEVDEETPDGRKVKTVFTLEGNVLTQLQKGEKETKIVRNYSDTEIITILTIDDIVCKRIFKLVT